MRLLLQGLGWMGRLALVLGVLGGMLLLGAIFSPWTRWPVVEEPPPPVSTISVLTEKAEQALLVGDLPQARQLAGEVLAQNPRNAPVLLMQACLALEVADSQTAKTALEQLRGMVPDLLEPQLLQRMMEHHTQSPGTGWRHAFLQAWRELGQPPFVNSPLLPEFDSATQGLVPAEAWKQASSDPVRLALVLGLAGLSEESARWLMGQLPALEDAALVQAVAAELLPAELPAAMRDRVHAVVRRRLEQLVEASPQVMQPRLVLLWAENPEEAAFSEQELETLEAIAALPRWKDTSFSETFLEARRHLKEAGVFYPSMGAYQVALWSNTHGATYALAKRAEITRRQLLPGARHRLGHILWSIGSRLSEQPTVMEHLVGLQLMEQGAADQGQEEERERAAQLLEAAKALRNAADMAALDRWPLPSLWEEVAEARALDEWAHRREFASPLAGPNGEPLQVP